MRLLSASWMLLCARLAWVAIATLPLQLSLRDLARRLADGDAALFTDLVPLLAEHAQREPRAVVPTLAPLVLIPLASFAEPVADRAATAIHAGQRWSAAFGAAFAELGALLGLGAFCILFRGAALACVYALSRHAAWDARSLAIPATVALLLGVFVAVILALRDAMCAAELTLRARLAAAVRALLTRPLALIATAAGGRLLAHAAVLSGFACIMQPSTPHGAALAARYALLLGATMLACVVRVWRLTTIAKLANISTASRRSDRADAPSAPNLDPSA